MVSCSRAGELLTRAELTAIRFTGSGVRTWITATRGMTIRGQPVEPTVIACRPKSRLKTKCRCHASHLEWLRARVRHGRLHRR